MASCVLLNRVFGPDLPADRCWYSLTKKLCGLQPSKFYKESSFVSKFPNEFKKVNLEDIAAESGAKGKQASFLFNGGDQRGSYAKNIVYVASPFGVLAAVLRQNPATIAALLENHFSFINEINAIELQNVDFPPKLVSVNRTKNNVSEKENDKYSDCETFVKLEKEIERLKSIISELETRKLQKVTPSRKAQSYNLPPTPAETPPLTPFTSLGNLRRNQRGKPRINTGIVWDNIQDVCAKFRQPLSSVLSQRVLQKDVEAKETLHKIVETVVGVRGVKRGIEAVLGDEVHQKLVRTMQVPDWVLLYFKLQARLPDQAWQTLLNLSMLGRSGVSFKRIFFMI